jgi:hypothetical protein
MIVRRGVGQYEITCTCNGNGPCPMHQVPVGSGMRAAAEQIHLEANEAWLTGMGHQLRPLPDEPFDERFCMKCGIAWNDLKNPDKAWRAEEKACALKGQHLTYLLTDTQNGVAVAADLGDHFAVQPPTMPRPFFGIDRISRDAILAQSKPSVAQMEIATRAQKKADKAKYECEKPVTWHLDKGAREKITAMVTEQMASAGNFLRAAIERVQCDCGAKFTENPNLHANWCGK